MDINYKRHLIESLSDLSPDGNRWLGKVIVLWEDAGTNRSQPFDGPLEGFSTKSEAESWGIQFGRKWIDDGKPTVNK